jgi:hypothetical protein
VAAALEGQRVLQREDWGVTGPLRARLGEHPVQAPPAGPGEDPGRGRGAAGGPQEADEEPTDAVASGGGEEFA